LDEKTLQYMGAKVDKARELLKKIDATQGRIDRLSRDELSSVHFSIDHSSVFYIDNKKQLGEIKAAAINALKNYRDSTQMELDEL